MLNQGISLPTSTTIMADPVGAPLPEAALLADVPERTLRRWCVNWPGLGVRDGRDWRIIDLDLLREMAARRVAAAGQLNARAAPPAGPQPVDVLPPGNWLSVDEAVFLLGVSRSTVERYATAIPGYGQRLRGDRGRWRIDPGVAVVVGALRQKQPDASIATLIGELDQALARPRMRAIRHALSAGPISDRLLRNIRALLQRRPTKDINAPPDPARLIAHPQQRTWSISRLDRPQGDEAGHARRD